MSHGVRTSNSRTSHRMQVGHAVGRSFDRPSPLVIARYGLGQINYGQKQFFRKRQRECVEMDISCVLLAFVLFHLFVFIFPTAPSSVIEEGISLILHFQFVPQFGQVDPLYFLFERYSIVHHGKGV